MEDKIQIGCPNCGAILSVKMVPGIESKSVTCPVCKKNAPFVNYKTKTASNDDDHTQYPGEENAYHKDEGETQVNLGANYTLGTLRHGSTTYRLTMGINIVGRKAGDSKANVQLPCTNRRMSREHLIIEIKRVPGSGLVHYVSLYKEQVNPTHVGSSLLEYGDKIVLKHNDVIKLPDMDLRFEIPDEEGTELI